MPKKFPFYKQLNQMDCGPTCLRMIAKYYGKHYSSETIRQKSGFGKLGVSLLGISEIAEKIGFRTRGVRITIDKLKAAPYPAILHWDQSHFVVLINIGKRTVKVADPDRGIIEYSIKEFETHWLSNHLESVGHTGTALLLEPAPEFYNYESEKEKKISWTTITRYLPQNRFQITQVVVSLLISSLLQLILPFLSQSMVDTGINTRNIQFITIILFAQLTLTFSSTFVEFIRSRLQMIISNRINIAILSDFWIKLTKLPLSYYETHHTGDTLQRLDDNKTVQSFLTGQAIMTLFNIFNLVVYSLILIVYNLQLFFIFALGSFIYFAWIQLFLGFRRKINYETFFLSSKENNATLQLVQGMQEIRLNNAEKLKRWDWENIQANLFKLNFKSLNYSQWQMTGALIINQTKDILISFVVAKLVVKGDLTFGAMLSVQYIIGQLSAPVSQFIFLSQSIQDAKISMERLNEIHEMKDEEPTEKSFISYLPVKKNIQFKQLSFTYPGAGNDPVLTDIDLVIPEGRVTAIVGMSGSGKTTLLKLLLKIFNQYSGEIKLGDSNFKNINPSFWRAQCGSVLQDGFIFDDTIARNIAMGDEYIDYDRLMRSCHLANILPFIDNLPNGLNTKLGAEGVGISTGQKQRILIARAVYKEPTFLFFDEATNSLDANNEKLIVENLNSFFKGRTVIIIAHRLSTVRFADKIVVLNNGKIVEEGDHSELTSKKGYYYELVKNQLELGS